MNGTYRRPLRAAALALLLCTAVRCDSGDIYESHQATTEGVSVRGTFELLNPEVFPGEYDLIFGAFGEGGTSALSSVNVLKPTDGDRVELSIENVPEDARSVRLCMTNSGRQVVYTFFEYALDDDRTSDIDLPSAQIDLLEPHPAACLPAVQLRLLPSGRERRGRTAADRGKQLPLAGRHGFDALGQAARQAFGPRRQLSARRADLAGGDQFPTAYRIRHAKRGHRPAQNLDRERVSAKLTLCLCVSQAKYCFIAMYASK